MKKEDIERLQNFSIEKFSDEELIVLKNIALNKQDVLVDDWATELKQIYDDKTFDQYSRKGEKVLEKFTEKHAELLSDVLETISMIDEELERRGQLNYKDKFTNYDDSEPDSLSEEDFLRIEQEKIDRIRKDIDSDDEY